MKHYDNALSPYRMAECANSEEHPVDVTIGRRLPQKKLRKRIRQTTERLLNALGDERHLWLRLEEQLGEYKANREEAYFNLGYEHGVAAGRAEALCTRSTTCITTPSADEVCDLASRVRDLAVRSDLPLPLTLASILETVWALVLGLPDGPTTKNRRNQ